jgi:hypothetical protein
MEVGQGFAVVKINKLIKESKMHEMFSPNHIRQELGPCFEGKWLYRTFACFVHWRMYSLKNRLQPIQHTGIAQ